MAELPKWKSIKLIKDQIRQKFKQEDKEDFERRISRSK